MEIDWSIFSELSNDYLITILDQEERRGKNSFGFLLSEKMLATAISLIGSELVMR